MFSNNSEFPKLKHMHRLHKVSLRNRIRDENFVNKYRFSPTFSTCQVSRENNIETRIIISNYVPDSSLYAQKWKLLIIIMQYVVVALLFCNISWQAIVQISRYLKRLHFITVLGCHFYSFFLTASFCLLFVLVLLVSNLKTTEAPRTLK